MNDESNVERVKTNAEIRQWYLEQVALIPELNEQWLWQGLSIKERAEMAWRIRHDARLQARLMMANPLEVELLRERDIALYGNPDGPTLELLVEGLMKAGLEGDSIYESIIEGSYRTDAGMNKLLGL